LILFPHAKINLGLSILEKRKDGYHNLETCFFPVFKLFDGLEILDTIENPSFQVFNADWTESKEKNLVWKSVEKFREYEPELGPISCFLVKNIPSGGGLGGGSSDASFALRLLAKKKGWKEDDPRLFEMAVQLGSDCAFFLQDGPMIGRGRGEILEPFSLDLSDYDIQFVFPKISVSTAEAFESVIPNKNRAPLKDILSLPIEEWRVKLKNDFEESVFKKYPQLAAYKDDFYEKGAVYASLSGSGSTLFGLFKK